MGSGSHIPYTKTPEEQTLEYLSVNLPIFDISREKFGRP